MTHNELLSFYATLFKIDRLTSKYILNLLEIKEIMM